MVLIFGVAPYYPPSAIVSLSAQDERPILVVEDLDHLLHSVSCSRAHMSLLGDVIVLNFLDEQVYHTATAEWRRLQGFAVITSHQGCNLDDERGAWTYVHILRLISLC